MNRLFYLGLFILLFSAKPIQADILILHPSGADATVNDTVYYQGGTAETALDSNDEWTSYGQSYDATVDYYLEIDNTNVNGTINSVTVKAVISESHWPPGTAEFRIGLKTNGTEYFSPALSQSNSAFILQSGNTYTTNPQTGTPWSWTDINNLIAIIDHTNNNSMRVTELYLEIDYTPTTTITISGTCKQADKVTDCTDTGTIRLATHANGGTLRPEKQEIVAGTWTISGIPPQATGLIMTIFIEGAPDHQEAVAVFNYDGSQHVTGVELIETHLSLGDDGPRGISNLDLSRYDHSVSGSEDIFHDVDESLNLTVDITGDIPNPTLYIKNNHNFAPGGNVNAHHVEINGIFGAGNNTINVSGDWDMTNGTFNRDTSTVNFTGSGTILNDVDTWWNKSFHKLSLAAPGHITTVPSNRGIIARDLVTLGTGTFQGGELVLKKATAPLIDHGVTFINGTIKFSPPSNTLQLDIPAGNYPSLWLASNNNGGSTTFTLQGNIQCTNLYIRGNGSNRRSILDANGHNINCTNLYIGQTDTSRNGSLILNGATLTLTRDLINFQGLNAPNHNEINAGTGIFNIGRSWSNRDTFIAGTSHVIFNGSDDQAIVTGGDPFYDVTIHNTGANNNKSVWVNSDITFNNDLIINHGVLDTTANHYNLTILGNLDQSSTTSELRANASTITITGNFSADGTLSNVNYNNASIKLIGTSSLNYTNIPPSLTAGRGFRNLTVGQMGQTTTTLSRFAVKETLSVGSGVFTGESAVIYLSGNTPLNLDPNAIINLNDLRFFGTNQTISPLNNGYDTNITLAGNNTNIIQTGNISLNTGKNLRLSGDNFSSRTVTYNTNGFDLNVGGGIFIGRSGGNDIEPKTLNISNSTVTVDGHFEIQTGTNDFISTHSTVILTGTQPQSITMNGKAMDALIINNTSSEGVTFTDAFTANTVTNTTPNSTLTFAAGQNFTVNNALNLQGASGQLINLVSSSPGNHWHLILNAGATKNIDHVNVSWSDASGSHSSHTPINPSNTARNPNTISWFSQPNLMVTKESTLISDPINGTGGEKNRIPGAIVEYRITVRNTGSYSPDSNTVVIQDSVDAHVEFDVISGINFTDGSPNSGLTLGNISYSHRNTPNNYNYTPTGTFDPNVAGIRIEMAGTFAFGGNPEFSLTYRVRLK